MGTVIILRLEGGSIGPRTECLVNWDGPVAMVTCLYLGNIYTKTKLRVWIDQKCIPLVGAIIPLTCAGRQKIHRLEGGSVGPSTESSINCDALISMVWCLHQGNISIKRKLRVWRDQKYIPLVGGITPLNCAGRHNTPSRGRQYRAQNGKFGTCAGRQNTPSRGRQYRPKYGKLHKL